MPFTSKCPCTNCTTSWPVRKMCPNHIIATEIAACKYLYHRADPTTTDIRGNFVLLERAVAQFDTRFTLRALRSISSLRKRLTDRVLCSVIILTYSPNNATARNFIEYIGMDGEAIQSVVSQYKEEVQLNKNNTKEPLPEVDIYIAILIQVCSQKVRLLDSLTGAGLSLRSEGV
jgi:26S proteasome regulatory subunit N3